MPPGTGARRGRSVADAGVRWGRAFLWFARIGPTPRPPIAFSPMTGSARRTFWLVIFNRRVIVSLPPMVSFWSCMTRHHVPERELPGDRHNQEHKQRKGTLDKWQSWGAHWAHKEAILPWRRTRFVRFGYGLREHPQIEVKVCLINVSKTKVFDAPRWATKRLRSRPRPRRAYPVDKWPIPPQPQSSRPDQP